MPTFYYYYFFRENNVEYFLPIRKEIPDTHQIKLDYFDYQLLEQLESNFENARREGHLTYNEQGREFIDNFLRTYDNANRKEILIFRKYFSEDCGFTMSPAPFQVFYFGDANSSPLRSIDIDECDRAYYLCLRNRYRPTKIKAIFLLEAPPKSGDYFYDERGSVNEFLFRAMMEAFNISATSKVNGLAQFRDKGLFLVDATYNHVDDIRSNTLRNSTIQSDEENLLRDLEIFRQEKTPIILVKANIFDIYDTELRELEFNVINNGIRIPFPSNGRQTEFQRNLQAVLESNSLTNLQG